VNKQQPEERKSELARAIEARERPTMVFDVSGFMGLGGNSIRQIAIRIPTKLEQDRALAGAHKYVQELAGDIEQVKSDEEILQDTKGAFIAFEFCRDVTNPNYPAFPGPKWMCQHLETERIGVLINLANEARAKLGPAPETIDDERIDQIIEACTKTAGSSIPETMMATFPREVLTQLVVLLSLKVSELRLLVEAAASEDKVEPA